MLKFGHPDPEPLYFLQCGQQVILAAYELVADLEGIIGMVVRATVSRTIRDAGGASSEPRSTPIKSYSALTTFNVI